MGAPSLPGYVSVGYGGAWVGCTGLNLKFKLFICSAMTWRGQRMKANRLGCQDRPTPGLKPKPQGPRPTPGLKPGVVAWAFSPNPRPNPRLIPHGLNLIFHPHS
ncbi:hypothetical protein Hanom_Chr04g00297031 [Helianthus anomalus]